MPDGFFLVHFTVEEYYSEALYEDPWMIAGHYLIVQRWLPMFLQNAQSVKKITVRIQIPRLPLELYNGTFLSRIGSTIGTMLKIDWLTSIH